MHCQTVRLYLLLECHTLEPKYAPQSPHFSLAENGLQQLLLPAALRRSISENVTWGKRKRFADGKVSLAYSTFLGYKKGEDGQMEIVPEEAETVRLIYRMFMQGKTPYAIAKYLTEQEIPTPTGKSEWRHRTVENILTNEKYKGDARLQKCYTVDFLSKKRKTNEGEVPQYYEIGRAHV